MDSRIRIWCALLLSEVNRVTAFHRHGQKVSDSILDRLANYQIEAEKALVLLTADPEPCESVKCLRCGDPIRVGICENCDTSQVADKRAEDLRAQVETLREAVSAWMSIKHTHDDNCHPSGGKHSDKCNQIKRAMDLSKQALAATEPKAQGEVVDDGGD